MLYLFAAYFILWAILFGYLWQVNAGQKRLQRELDLIRQADADRPPDASSHQPPNETNFSSLSADS